MNTKNASKECQKTWLLVTNMHFSRQTLRVGLFFGVIDECHPDFQQPNTPWLTCWWLNQPIWNISVKMKHFPIFRWWKPKKHLSCHHLAPGEVEPKSPLSKKNWCFSQHLPLPPKKGWHSARHFFPTTWLLETSGSTGFNVLLCWLHWFQSTMMAARNKQQKKHNKRNPTKILQGTFQQVKNGRKMVSCCVLVLKKMTTQNAQMVKAKPENHHRCNPVALPSGNLWFFASMRWCDSCVPQDGGWWSYDIWWLPLTLWFSSICYEDLESKKREDWHIPKMIRFLLLIFPYIPWIRIHGSLCILYLYTWGFRKIVVPPNHPF